jgi:hypothetical protein
MNKVVLLLPFKYKKEISLTYCRRMRQVRMGGLLISEYDNMVCDNFVKLALAMHKTNSIETKVLNISYMKVGIFS